MNELFRRGNMVYRQSPLSPFLLLLPLDLNPIYSISYLFQFEFFPLFYTLGFSKIKRPSTRRESEKEGNLTNSYPKRRIKFGVTNFIYYLNWGSSQQLDENEEDTGGGGIEEAGGVRKG